MKKRNPFTVNLTSRARLLLETLSVRLGLTKKGVLELAIREVAKREGISNTSKGEATDGEKATDPL